MDPVTELRARRRISWGELGPRLVPALAVLAAVLFGGLFMVFSGTDWAAARAALAAEGVGGFLRELGPGIGKAGAAYAAMGEGARGFGYIAPSSVRAQTTVLLLLRLGERSIVFIPDNLVPPLVRSPPFLLAGLAVAVGFKAG